MATATKRRSKAEKANLPVDYRLSRTYVPGVGPKPARVMLVGEGPGKVEDARREPFVGPSGQLLTDILERHRLLRSDIYITNIIKRRIADDEDPTPEEIELFRPDLLAELEEVDPEIIIAAGGFATRFFLGPDANLELLHGMPIISTAFGLPVVPCFHPASALHETDQMAAVYWDYQRAVGFVNGQVPIHEVRKRKTRILDASRMPAHLPAGSFVAIDTEDLVDGQPWCATVSWSDGDAAFIPPDHYRGLEILRMWLEDPALTIFIHNSMHDLKPLRKMGVHAEPCFVWDGEQAKAVDTMVLAFEQGKIHAQGLKTLAYRLLGVQMQAYEDIVGPVAQQRAFEYLLNVYTDPSWPDAEAEAMWDEKTGKVKITKPWSIERRVARILADYEKDPTGTDLIKRWSNIEDKVLLPVVQKLGALPGTDLSHCDPQQAKHYACQDADLTRQLGILLLQRHSILSLDRIAAIDHGQIPMVERMQENGLPSNKQYFLDLGAEMRVKQQELAGVLEALVGRPVNPNSSDQVAQLLYAEMGLTPAKLTRKGKASTGKKALEHLRKTNDLVDYIMTSREYGKVDDAFCQNIADRTIVVGCDPNHPAVPDEERAFYELMVTRVKTGRLAAKNFNSLAIPVRTELGNRIRKGFKARPGRLLGTWDLNQIEMRVMAHRSQDPRMIEIYNRDPKKFPKWERDLHIYTVSQIYDYKPLDIYEHHKKLRTACKSTGFGIIMGITERGLADQMRLYGLDPEEWTEDRCEELIRSWLTVFKGVRDYQQIKRAEARRYGQITDMFGRLYRLPHATCPLSWIREEAERQSHALDIQGSAQAIEKIAMQRINSELLPEIRQQGYCEPCLQVHDELILEFDEDLLPMLDPMMIYYLTTATTMSVPIEAGGAVGESWGDLEK